MCGCRKSGKWSNIRQLTWCRIVDGDDLEDHIFVYGADGIRCRKDNIYYTRDGDRILSEYNDNTGKTITYLYGEKGIVGFNYDAAPHIIYYKFKRELTNKEKEVITKAIVATVASGALLIGGRAMKKVLYDGAVNGIFTLCFGGAGSGTNALNHASKLFTNNLKAAIKNGSSSRVQGVIVNYIYRSRPVNSFLRDLHRSLTNKNEFYQEVALVGIVDMLDSIYEYFTE